MLSIVQAGDGPKPTAHSWLCLSLSMLAKSCCIHAAIEQVCLVGPLLGCPCTQLWHDAHANKASTTLCYNPVKACCVVVTGMHQAIEAVRQTGMGVTCNDLLDGCFKGGGGNHQVAPLVYNHTPARPLVQKKKLSSSGHHILHTTKTTVTNTNCIGSLVATS